MQITIGNNTIDTTQRAAVMAIVNITPDSFYGASRSYDQKSLQKRICEVIQDGADIIDLGGCSSRPMAEPVTIDEELRRLTMAMQIVRATTDLPVSIDTVRSEVVERIYDNFGPFMVNDISGGDEQMFSVVAKLNLPYICMHMRGTPQTMQSMTDYEDVVREVDNFFVSRIEKMHSKGIQQIVLDPGIGFAKTLEQNYQLIDKLPQFAHHNCPLLIGISRKSLIYKLLDITAEQALPATTALHWQALTRGANILRVHDIKEAVQCITLFERYKQMTI